MTNRNQKTSPQYANQSADPVVRPASGQTPKAIPTKNGGEEPFNPAENNPRMGGEE